MRTAEENRNTLNGFMASYISDDSFVVELGCGKGDRLEYIQKYINSNCMGVEIFEPYMKICQDKNLTVVHQEIQEYIKKHKTGLSKLKTEFLLIDVLEHFTKPDGAALISSLKEIGHKILIFCPLGKVPQEEYDGNAYQKHLSSWFEEDFIEMGFQNNVIRNFHSGLPAGWSTDVIFSLWEKNEQKR